VPRIVGISGSLRRGSFNTALLRTAVDLMPAGAELKMESIEGIPQRLLVSRAQGVFDEHGKMTDETIRKQLEQFLEGFVEFVGV
jgi:NAD(P)H-dependent FMN reductase